MDSIYHVLQTQTYQLLLNYQALKSIHNAVPKANNYIKNFFATSIKNARPIIKRFKPIIGRIKRNCQTTCKNIRN